MCHDVVVTAELEFQVHHCLMSLPGQPLESIHTVISHPQALAQCEDFITNLRLKAEKQYDTAGSARLIRDGALQGTAAIASSLAAEVYGLQVLATHCEDDDNNYTRFLLISKASAPPPSLLSPPLAAASSSPPASPARTKTSIVFALKDEAGVLFKALSVFALRDIHLSKIESRPGKRLRQLLSVASNEVRVEEVGGLGGSAVFKYLFYADVLAHQQESRAVNALNHLREIAPFLRVLGSYPAAASLLSSSLLEARVPVAAAASSSPLTIGIVGFGTFGQFLARAFVRHAFRVVATSRSDYASVAGSLSVGWCGSTAEFVACRPDIVVLAMSILSFAETVASFPWSQLPRDCLVVDVLSVKLHARATLLAALPPHLSVLCTHPMFGPDSGKYSWRGLPLMYDSVRVSPASAPHAAAFLSVFQREGCRMLEMSCEMHDAYAAGSQFLTHTTGRVLSKLGCESTPINTKGYSQLLELIANTCRDSNDLYRGLFAFNPHSRTQLMAFDSALQAIKAELMGAAAAGEKVDGSAQQNGVVQHKEEERKEPPAQHAESKLQLSTAASSPPPAAAATDGRWNPRVLAMNESKTAQVTDLAKRLASQGQRIVSLSVGEPIDIPTPAPIIAAAVAALQRGDTKYTPVAGLLELRRAIVAKLQRENGLQYAEDEVVVSNGAKQSIMQAVMALSCDGDEVVIPAPYWVSYPDICVMCGSRPVIVQTEAGSGYVMSGAQLRAVMTPRTKLVILCSPSNPTGGVYSRAQLEELAAVLRDFPSCWLLSDEIYEHLVFDGSRHVSFASLPGMQPRTITVNGFSKCFSMTGFRLGYIAAPRAVAALCNKVQGQITSCASSISQHAGIAALQFDSAAFSRSMLDTLQRKRDMVLAVLRSIPGVSILTPKGAFYAMPDVSAYYGRSTQPAGDEGEAQLISGSDELCLWLLQRYKVALVPGSAFGAPNTVRISYASDEEEVRQGVTALKRCLEELR